MIYITIPGRHLAAKMMFTNWDSLVLIKTFFQDKVSFRLGFEFVRPQVQSPFFSKLLANDLCYINKQCVRNYGTPISSLIRYSIRKEPIAEGQQQMHLLITWRVKENGWNCVKHKTRPCRGIAITVALSGDLRW